MNLKNGAWIASTVAVMLAAVACGSDDSGGEDVGAGSQEVKCEGVNECKGTSECKGTDGSNECQGLNECKGQGWVTTPTAEACTSQGGKVLG